MPKSDRFALLERTRHLVRDFIRIVEKFKAKTVAVFFTCSIVEIIVVVFFSEIFIPAAWTVKSRRMV